MIACTTSPIASALLKKFMNWDSSEGVWELILPLPTNVTIDLGKLEPPIDRARITAGDLAGALMEFEAVVGPQEGLTYESVSVGGGSVSILGLREN